MVVRTIAELCILGALFYIAILDLRFRKIPNPGILLLLFGGIGMHIGRGIYMRLRYGELLSVWHGSISSYWLHLTGDLVLGLIVPLLILYPLYRLHMIGAGDVKLMAAVGCIRGWGDLPGVALHIAIWAALLSLSIMVRHGTLGSRWRYFTNYIRTMILTKNMEPYVSEGVPMDPKSVNEDLKSTDLCPRTADTYSEVPKREGSYITLALPVFLGNLSWVLLKGRL